MENIQFFYQVYIEIRYNEINWNFKERITYNNLSPVLRKTHRNNLGTDYFKMRQERKYPTEPLGPATMTKVMINNRTDA